MTQHPADFYDSHNRHLEDAELLYSNNRLCNADQLYGFAAECGLKRFLLAMGMNVDSVTGSPTDKYRKHIHQLWPLFRAFPNGRNGSWFLSHVSVANPFANWLPDDRYAHRTATTLSVVTQHRTAAQTLQQVMQKAVTEGRI